MNDKLFYRILTAVTALGIISVFVLLFCTYQLYSDCSVISYIANRG
ncbi:MAG: hypothetical protein MJ081_01165 [Ruminococcus sp.]|nr:hypothetical protein [Ruminococcus sp.]